MERLLVVFARWPEPGRTKTRLVPALGAAGAAALQREMTEHTLRRIADAADRAELWYAGGDEARLRAWLGGALTFRPQGSGNLGERMRRAIEEGFAAGAGAVVLIGTDCPELGARDLRDAFAALESADAVLGPAGDGGYWLIGVRRAARAASGALFDGIPWGGPRVLEATVAAAAACGIGVRLLRTLADVDRPEDLPVWERAVGAAGPAIAVVIPALNEGERIGGLVGALRAEAGLEIVVADGGSTDGTPERAGRAGARVVVAPRGRGRQMNAGAAATDAGILLFLHADTRLPAGFGPLVREALADERVAGGAFAFATDSPRPALRAIERAANWRGRALGVVFGDQAIFARRAAFDRAGGYPAEPIFEDATLVRRLRAQGRFALLAPAAVCSARRWHARGVWRTSAANALVTAAWAAGVPPRALARWHRRLLGS